MKEAGKEITGSYILLEIKSREIKQQLILGNLTKENNRLLMLETDLKKLQEKLDERLADLSNKNYDDDFE